MTPLMMDYIASKMDMRDLRNIIKNKQLPQNIAEDESSVYGKSFTALERLTEEEKVKNCLQMVQLLAEINMEIEISFKKKFKAPQQG